MAGSVAVPILAFAIAALPGTVAAVYATTHRQEIPMRTRSLVVGVSLLFCLLSLALPLGCGARFSHRGSSTSPAPQAAVTSPAAWAGLPVEVCPPRLPGSEAVSEIAVRVKYGRLHFPLRDRKARTASFVQIVDRKLLRYHVRAKLLTEGEDPGNRPVLTMLYSEKVSPLTAWSGRRLRATAVRLELTLEAPWLPSKWHRVLEEERAFGLASRPVDTEKDLRDWSGDCLDEDLSCLAFPFGLAYAGGEVAASASPESSITGLAQRGDTLLISVYDNTAEGIRIYRLNGQTLRTAGSVGGEVGTFAIVNPEMVAVAMRKGDVILHRLRPDGGMQKLSRVPPPTGIKDPGTPGLCGRGDRVYAVYGDGEQLVEIGVTDPARPQVLRTLALPESVGGSDHLALAGDHVLCLLEPTPLFFGEGALWFLSMDGATLQVLGEFPLPSEEGMRSSIVADARFAYAIWDNSSVMCFDLYDPHDPREAFQILTPGRPAQLALHANRLLIADDDGGLFVVDLTDPEHPQALGSVDVGGFADQVAFDGALAAATVSPRGPYRYLNPPVLKMVRFRASPA